MGKDGGFLEYGRKDPGYRPKKERLKDYQEVELRPSESELRDQAARCMECGVPFCHGCGCPLQNIIPEFNDLVYRERWQEALVMLLETNCFPEFTGRICPAPCETSCVLGINDDPVTIRQVELAIIEKGFELGYMKPAPPEKRTGKRVAVIGSGPAGLAAAQVLNQEGHAVTVFEKDRAPGGILRYGIPDFKLDKGVIDRRVSLMRDEGVLFETNVLVGRDISFSFIQDRFDAICLAGGAREPRNLNVPGRELKGTYFAMEFLKQQNRVVAGERIPQTQEVISAKGKSVVVIGGGDTGSDCIGTALRQGAKKVYQFEIMPKPLWTARTAPLGRCGRMFSRKRAVTKRAAKDAGM
jgi:glutamate synthase (NADPH/NADH) small chain